MPDQVYVFKVCECDAVAALCVEDAVEYYKKLTGVGDEDLYPIDEIEMLPPDYLVYDDYYTNPDLMITLAELIEREWTGEPFIACSTEW